MENKSPFIKKPFYKRKALLLSIFYCVGMTSIALYAYYTLAWFTSTRTAQVNFSQIQVANGFSASLKYCSLNDNATTEGGVTTHHYNGYRQSRVSTLTSLTSFTYANNFLSATDESRSNAVFSPDYTSTFVIEITNQDSSSHSVKVYLTQYTALRSAVNYYLDGGANHFVSLDEAFDVYTYQSDDVTSSSGLSSLKSFMNNNSTDSVNYPDRFVYTRGSDDATGTALANEDPWSGTISVPANGTTYFFMSLYFSNAASTFYLKGDTTDGTTLWSKDGTNGNSNIYNNLSITFNSLAVALA
jgi:hypothetical protein